MKKWIKLLKAYDGKPAGELVEVDEPIAKALIAGGIACDGGDGPEKSLIATAAAEFTAGLETIAADVAKALKGATAAIHRPELHVEVVANEVDKLLPTGGFQSIGHFGHTVLRAHKGTADADCVKALSDWHDLVKKGTPSGMAEGSDPDGGDLIPPTYAQTIWERARAYENLGDRIELTPISGNTMRFPADAESSRANGSRRGGIQGFWEGEADQYTKSKPTFRYNDLRLKKVTVLVYATNEVLEDTGGALESILNRYAPEELAFKFNDALINGNGAGILQGIMKAACLVTVNKDSGQAAATLSATNIINMWARLYTGCRRNAAWYINQDIEPQLAQMALATGTYSGQLVYMPPTGLSESPYATLQGRPVIPIEQCQTLGTTGDIFLADFSQYQGIKKASGIQQAMSMHLRFDYDETVFKFSMRCDAQPAWQSALTPFKGTNTQSPFVALQTR